MEHPPKDLLLRFALNATSRQENRLVVRHLLARCPSCAATLRVMSQEPPLYPPPGPETYDPVLDRLVAFVREVGLPQSSAISERPARQRWLFG